MTDFEPRSGKRDDLTEIGYTGTEDTPYTPGDEVPPGATVIDLSEEGDEERKLVIRQEGVQKTLRADKAGIFHPKSAEEAAAADAFDLPVARATSEPTKDTPAGGKGDD